MERLADKPCCSVSVYYHEDELFPGLKLHGPSLPRTEPSKDRAFRGLYVPWTENSVDWSISARYLGKRREVIVWVGARDSPEIEFSENRIDQRALLANSSGAMGQSVEQYEAL